MMVNEGFQDLMGFILWGLLREFQDLHTTLV